MRRRIRPISVEYSAMTPEDAALFAKKPSIQHSPFCPQAKEGHTGSCVASAKETVSIASLCAKLEDARDKLHEIRKLCDRTPDSEEAGHLTQEIREILNRA